jgi:HSP20 family molecular chaperone IbpA
MCDCLRGSHNTNSLLKELITMGNLMKFHTKDLPELMDRINRYSIGMDDYFARLSTLHETQSNYPPYNLVQLSNVEYRLELALAGFKKEEINVYTQDSKLFVEGRRDDTEPAAEYLHRGMAQRSFTRTWNLSDQTEVRSVTFEDGLLSVTLGKVVPEHHQRKDYL